MGKHANADAADDQRSPDESGITSSDTPHAPARHAAQPGNPLEPQAVISADTHVGAEHEGRPAGAEDAAPSPADPDALIEHGLVGDGHELE